MEKTKHTPGPWEVESGMVQTTYDHKCKLPGCGVRIPIAYMDREIGNGTLPVERDCNARLISAAPELLAALKLAKSRLNDETNHNALTTIRAAIAKAEGN